MTTHRASCLTLEGVLQLMEIPSSNSSGAGVKIEVMDGPWGNHHLKVMAVIRRLVPAAEIRYTEIVDPSNHVRTLRNAEKRLQEILASDDPPDIINNSWEFPRTPTKAEVQGCQGRKPIDFSRLSYDQERTLYPCHPDHPFTKLVQEAVRRGITMVFAAGNRGLDRGPKLFPGRISGANGLPEVITVGAMDTFGHRCPSSSHGPSTFGKSKPDVYAMSNYLINEELGVFGGTSAAAPIVSGVLGLGLSLDRSGLDKVRAKKVFAL